MPKTLEELKRENAALEENAEPEKEVEVLEEGEELDVKEEEGALDGEESGDETTAEHESWMQDDNESSDSESGNDETVPVAKHIDVRRKLKGKLSEKNTEIDELKSKIAELESTPGTSQTSHAGEKPKREDFYTEDDPDEAYLDAVLAWKDKKRLSEAQANQTKLQQLKVKQNVEVAVENHYERAAELLDKHGIDESVYQGADKAFRQAIESALPENGDAVTDVLISQLGEGSEKLLFYVGRNKARREQLKQAFESDSTGLKAMRLLGQFEAQIKQPQKRVSNAPAPAAQLQGGKTTASSRGLLKKYKEAHAKGNVQAAYNAKKQAKEAGVDTQDW